MFEKLSKRARLADAKRYESTYRNMLEKKIEIEPGLKAIESKYKRPFLRYYEILGAQIGKSDKVLELGCGTGIHTEILCDLSNQVSVLDISKSSLDLCSTLTNNRVNCLLGSMDEIPVSDNVFDVIVSCGSFSYVSWKKLSTEIIRVSKPGAKLIFLDSLNHNPIYIFNRLTHVLRKQRTMSTVLRIPTKRKLKRLLSNFQTFELYYFDPIMWLFEIMPWKHHLVDRFNLYLERTKLGKMMSFKVVGIGSYLIK